MIRWILKNLFCAVPYEDYEAMQEEIRKLTVELSISRMAYSSLMMSTAMDSIRKAKELYGKPS